MPTYGYRCEKNGHEFEVFQSMIDEPLQKCTVCRSPVRRIFYPVGIVFKGPGFYKTDSRGGSSASTPAAPGGDDKGDSPDAAPAKADKADKSDKSATKSDSGGKSESKSKKSEPKSGSKKSA